MAKTPRVTIKKLSYDQHMQKLAMEYRQEFGVDVFDPDAVVDWAIATKRWGRKPPTQAQLCRRDLLRALRKQTYRDPQGREPRLMHFVRGEQQTLAYDIRTAPPPAMRASLQDRRRGIFADVRQVNVDRESWNENNQYGGQLDMDFNFNLDLAESKKPTSYPDEKPEK
jgi:hypothetical protein